MTDTLPPCNWHAQVHVRPPQALADEGRLGAILTEGRPWFAIETRPQLESAARETVHMGRTAFPWQVRLARETSPATLLPCYPGAHGACGLLLATPLLPCYPATLLPC